MNEQLSSAKPGHYDPYIWPEPVQPFDFGDMTCIFWKFYFGYTAIFAFGLGTWNLGRHFQGVRDMVFSVCTKASHSIAFKNISLYMSGKELSVLAEQP